MDHSGLTQPPDLVLPRRNMPPLLLSLMLHLLLLVAFGVAWTIPQRGTIAEPERQVGIAMVHRLPDRDRYVDAAERLPQDSNAESETGSVAETGTVADDSASLAPPADMESPIDLAGMLQAMNTTPSVAEASGLAGDSILGDDAFGSGSLATSSTVSDKATAILFGVSGSGSRFVYVFDRSDSMNGFGGSPLRAAKTELIRSLGTLTEKQQFQLIFYNDVPKPFQPAGMPLQLVNGEPSMVAAAQRYVESVVAFGGTEHDTALKMALRMSPDVIFFLTDARIPRLSGSQLSEIRNRAERNGTTIHAIEFGVEPIAPTDSFLRNLAAQNGGQYQYMDVQGFQSDEGSGP